MVSESDWTELNRQAGKGRASDQFYNKLKDRNIASFDDVLPIIDQYQQLQGDPTTNSVLEALRQSRVPQPEAQTQEPFTAESIKSLIADELRSHDQNQIQAQITQAQQRESALLTQVIGEHEALKTLFGETSFDDAITGKGTVESAHMAAMLDNALARRAQPFGDGNLMPVTDPAQIREAVNEVGEVLKSFKAKAIFEASSAPTGLEKPSAEGVVTPTEQPGMDDAVAREAELNRKARETFETTFKQAMASGGGLPASQG
jgi:hypothetical protein